MAERIWRSEAGLRSVRRPGRIKVGIQRNRRSTRFALAADGPSAVRQLTRGISPRLKAGLDPQPYLCCGLAVTVRQLTRCISARLKGAADPHPYLVVTPFGRRVRFAMMIRL